MKNRLKIDVKHNDRCILVFSSWQTADTSTGKIHMTFDARWHDSIILYYSHSELQHHSKMWNGKYFVFWKACGKEIQDKWKFNACLILNVSNGFRQVSNKEFFRIWLKFENKKEEYGKLTFCSLPHFPSFFFLLF